MRDLINRKKMDKNERISDAEVTQDSTCLREVHQLARPVVTQSQCMNCTYESTTEFGTSTNRI